jgi:hypothetical protein
VILRAPKWSDLDDMLEYINGLVEEKAIILIENKLTRESEIDWLSRNISDLERCKHIVVVAETACKMIANCEN